MKIEGKKYVKDLLKEIFEDLSKNESLVNKLKTVSEDSPFLFNFGTGMYVRNKYLWGNEKNIQLLSVYYETFTVDDISKCILKDFYEKIV